MNFRKKLLLGSSILGLFSPAAIVSAQSTESVWQPRTVEEVAADIVVNSENEVSYTVKYGDTLSVISEAMNIEERHLAEINDIEDVDLIFPDTVLTARYDANQNAESLTVDTPSGDTLEFDIPVDSTPTSEAANNGSEVVANEETEEVALVAPVEEWIVEEDDTNEEVASSNVQLNQTNTASTPGAGSPSGEQTAVENTVEEPIAEEPVVEEPAAEAPVTEAPVTEAPVTEAPVAEEPVAEAPVAEEPVVEEPVVEAPVAEEPVVEEPVAEAPVAEEPIVEEPVAEVPVAEEPVAEEPIVEEPVAEEPIVEEPIVEEPVVEEPATEEPVVEEPIVEEPVVEEPATEEPVVEEPIVEETEAEIPEEVYEDIQEEEVIAEEDIVYEEPVEEAPVADPMDNPSNAGLQPHVAAYKDEVANAYGIDSFSTYRPGDPGDHGQGLAVDFMVPIGSQLGDDIADYSVNSMGTHDISYVIWEQQIYGDWNNQWVPMEDRGSATANHYDHVHVSFY